MSFRVRGLATSPVAVGFRLAGVATDEVSTVDAAARRLEELAGQTDVGVVLMEQSLFDEIPDSLRHRLSRRALPVIVPVPRAAREAGTSGEEYILELLLRAIGYRVRLQ